MYIYSRSLKRDIVSVSSAVYFKDIPRLAYYFLLLINVRDVKRWSRNL